MKITFELQATEISQAVISEIKTQASKHFEQHKDSFIKASVEANTKTLKQDQFFTRQVSSALNKAVYDKVNREFSDLIERKIEKEIERVLKIIDLEKTLNKEIDRRVKQKLNEILSKI